MLIDVNRDEHEEPFTRLDDLVRISYRVPRMRRIQGRLIIQKDKFG